MSSTSPSLKLVCPPLPETQRGYRTILDSTKKGNLLAYCNSKHIFIRSLDNLDQVELFSEHKCNVCVAKFSPNGEWIASGDAKGRVFIWAVKSQLIKIEIEVNKRVIDIAWSEDGQRIVAVGQGKDTFAKVFMWNSGNTVGEISGHTKYILSVDYKPTRPFRIVTGSEDQAVHFYTGPPFKLDSKKHGHSRYPNCVAFSKSGEHFISVGGDKKIILYDGKTGEQIKEFESENDGHTSSILSFAWNNDGTEILTASMDKTCKIWKVPEGTVSATFKFEEDADIGDQQVSTLWHDKFIVSQSLRGNLNFLDSENPSQPKKVLHGHVAPLVCLAVDRSSEHVYSADGTGRVIRWNSKNSEGEEVKGTGHSGSIIDMDVSSDGSKFVTVGIDDTYMINDPLAFGNSTALGGQPAGVAASKSTPGLSYVVTKALKLLVIQNGSIKSSTDLPWKPTALAVSFKDDEIAIAGETKLILMSLGPDGAKLKSSLDKHTEEITCLTYSPCGKYFISADKGRHIWVWDRQNLKNLNSGWKFHSAAVTSVEFSPDSKMVASTSLDGNIIIWRNLDTFKNERTTIEPAHWGGIFSVKWVNNSTVASCGEDRCVKFWTVA